MKIDLIGHLAEYSLVGAETLGPKRKENKKKSIFILYQVRGNN